VWDSGPGIPPDQERYVFSEFYRLAAPDRDRRSGLGLGLAIVERLGRLLEHPVELRSWPGKGSRFAVSVPIVAARGEPAEAPRASALHVDPARGKVILVIDDDPLVLDSMRGLLLSWGCIVVTAESGQEALSRLAGLEQSPDLVVSDYRLADGKSGIETIELLRGALGASTPAFLISGDTDPERLRNASANGILLLHKPVPALKLRAVLNRFLKTPDEFTDIAPLAQPQSSQSGDAAPRRARARR
jgi:CheY-like chemotaxis protein